MNSAAQPPQHVVEIERMVEWPDTDAAGHYHHSTILRWVEAAEAELYDRAGIVDIFGVIPRVHLEVSHKKRLWFRDRVSIQIWINSLGRSSITYSFQVRQDDELAAVGSMTAVHIDPELGHSLEWPASIRSALDALGVSKSEVASE